jgi:hypothetical protein
LEPKEPVEELGLVQQDLVRRLERRSSLTKGRTKTALVLLGDETSFTDIDSSEEVSSSKERNIGRMMCRGNIMNWLASPSEVRRSIGFKRET